MQKLKSIIAKGLKGINSDVAPWDLPAEFITSGLNFRIFADKIVSVATQNDWTATEISDNFGHLHFVPSATEQEFWMALGRNSVQVYDGGDVPATAWHNISRISYGLAADQEFDWTVCQSGKIPVVNNTAIWPEYWDPQQVSTDLKQLPFVWGGDTFEDRGIRGKVIRSHKNFLFLLNLTEGAEQYPSAYRWSHPADINGLPPSWDETDPSYIAGRAQIEGDSGQILDGRTLRNTFIIYSENAINKLEESNDSFIFRRRPMTNNIGLLNRNSLIAVKDKHYFIGDGDIYVNNGNEILSIIHDRIRLRFNAAAGSEFFYRSYITRNTALKEIWFCVPEGSSEYPNTAFVYNWRDDSWGIQSILGDIVDSDYGAQITPSLTFDEINTAFDDMGGVTFDSQVRTPLNETVIGLTNTGALKILDPQISPAGTVTNAYFERISFPLEGNRQVNKITRIYPHVQSPGPINIQIGSQLHVGAPITWTPKILFDPTIDRKIDIISSGMLHSWHVETIDAGTFIWSGMDIEYSSAGIR